MKSKRRIRAVWGVAGLLALGVAGCGRREAWPPTGATIGDTLFTDCMKTKSPHVVSLVSFSEDHAWRAYVDVDQENPECVLTTSLRVAHGDGQYRLVYFMSPMRDEDGNGMEILGWSPAASMLLVKTERWQWGSDGDDEQRVLAIEAATGRVYEPNLDAILEAHRNKQCRLRIQDAGFASRRNMDVLVRVSLSTAYDVDETEEDVSPEKRCGNLEETWRFNSAGDVKQLGNGEALRLYKSGQVRSR